MTLTAVIHFRYLTVTSTLTQNYFRCPPSQILLLPQDNRFLIHLHTPALPSFNLNTSIKPPISILLLNFAVASFIPFDIYLLRSCRYPHPLSCAIVTISFLLPLHVLDNLTDPKQSSVHQLIPCLAIRYRSTLPVYITGLSSSTIIIYIQCQSFHH